MDCNHNPLGPDPRASIFRRAGFCDPALGNGAARWRTEAKLPADRDLRIAALCGRFWAAEAAVGRSVLLSAPRPKPKCENKDRSDVDVVAVG